MDKVVMVMRPSPYTALPFSIVVQHFRKLGGWGVMGAMSEIFVDIVLNQGESKIYSYLTFTIKIKRIFVHPKAPKLCI